MALLRRGTEKKPRIEDIFDSDSDISDEEGDDHLSQLRKDNEDKYNLNQRVMVRYGTDVDQK